MSHIFISPHPDDAALSCGGLIAHLRELGQNVIIISVFSGHGDLNRMSPYQRQALGFGGKTIWPSTQAFDSGSIATDVAVPGETASELAPWQAEPARIGATQQEADASAKEFWQRASWYRKADISGGGGLPHAKDVDTVGGQGTHTPGNTAAAAAAGEAMAQRKVEDEYYALFSEAAVVFLDLPDAVFRGYEGDDELLGSVRPGDAAPITLLEQEITRLEPQHVYFPLGIGSHVDHQLARKVGAALLAEPRKWAMPGPDWASKISFYEDFPYAWWNEFDPSGGLPAEYRAELPADISLTPEIADISNVIETKIQGIKLYASQVPHLFGSDQKMADAVRGHGARVALAAGKSGSAERYWSAVRRS